MPNCSAEAILSYDEFDIHGDREKMTFFESDISEVLLECGCKDKVYIIRDLWVAPEKRNNGAGSRMLTGMIEEHKDSLIFLAASLLTRDYPEQPTEKEYDEGLLKAALFFETRGFRNINALCGFEYKVPYVYMNTAAKSFIKEVVKLEHCVL